MDTTSDLLLAMKKTRAIYTSLLRLVSESDAHQIREQEGEWNIVEILCHLRDAEEIAIARDKKMLENVNPEIESYNPDCLVTKGNYDANTMDKALSEFLQFRDQHICLLKDIHHEEWQRGGMHTSAGALTIADHNTHMVAHDFDHAGQIADTLASK